MNYIISLIINIFILLCVIFILVCIYNITLNSSYTYNVKDFFYQKKSINTLISTVIITFIFIIISLNFE